MKSKSTISVIFLSLLILVLFGTTLNYYFRHQNLKKEMKNISISTYQSILSDKKPVKIIDKTDSSWIVKNELLTISNKELETFLKIQNSKLTSLQKEIEKYKKENDLLSVSLYQSNLDLKTKNQTVVTKTDSLPVYNSQFELGYDKINKKSWVVGYVLASADSTEIKLSIHNRYSLIIGKNKKSKLGFADIKSANPYFDVDSVRIMNVELPKETKYGLMLTFGYGVMYNNIGNLTHGPTITLGFGKKLR